VVPDAQPFRRADLPTCLVLSKTDGGAGAGFGGLGFSVAMRSGGLQRMEQARGGEGDLVNGRVEGGFVGFRGMVEAGDFADELEGSGADFVRGDRGIEVKKGFDVAAHETSSSQRPDD
jgi:hypothetical protein